jgi:nicotinamide-nucleotide amidase
VIALPGPPHEMRAVLSPEVMDRIVRRLGPPGVAQRVLQVAGVPESDLEDRIADLYGREAGAEVTVLARAGQVEILVLVRDDEPERASAGADRLCERITARLGDAVFAAKPTTLAAAVGERLRRAGATVAVAESCTGGLLGADFTSAPGSSDYFLGGVVAYGDRIKQELLGVTAATLRQSGAVSEETARAMAEGVRTRFGADYAIAVTGVAGPEGGSPEKPVGRVYIAIAGADGVDAHRHDFRGDRDRVRRWTVGRALDHLRHRLDRRGGDDDA